LEIILKNLYIFLSLFFVLSSCSESETTEGFYKTHSVQIKKVENNSSQVVKIETFKFEFNDSILVNSSYKSSFEINSSTILDLEIENCDTLDDFSFGDLNESERKELILCKDFELLFENLYFEEFDKELSSIKTKLTFESGEYRTFAGWEQEYYEDSLIDDYGLAYIKLNQSKIVTKLDPTTADLNATENQELYLNLLINSPDDIQFSINKNLSTGFGY
jgi:hypothetical protein